MAKKQEETKDPFGEAVPEPAVPVEGDYGEDEGINFETDFNLEDEYKPTPLCPKGNYFGMISGVKWDGQNNALIWDVTLGDDNDGVMSDGVTPIAGQVFDYRNWFPRPGDENEMSARGRQTKRQAKINMIKDFSDKMKLDMSSPKAIISAVQNQDWLGYRVVVTISVEQYQGRFRNNIARMVRSE